MKYFDLTKHIAFRNMPIIAMNFYGEFKPANDHFDIVQVSECREIMETARDVADTFKTCTLFTKENIAKARRMDIRLVD